jgi:hypothetical protein
MGSGRGATLAQAQSGGNEDAVGAVAAALAEVKHAAWVAMRES